MMVIHKIKLKAVIGLIYLLPFTRRSPSVTLKISPNAKKPAVTFRTLLINIANWKQSYNIFRRVKRANKQTNRQMKKSLSFSASPESKLFHCGAFPPKFKVSITIHHYRIVYKSSLNKIVRMSEVPNRSVGDRNWRLLQPVSKPD